MLTRDKVGVLIPQTHGDEERVPGAAVIGNNQRRSVDLEVFMGHVELVADPAVRDRIQETPDFQMPFVLVQRKPPFLFRITVRLNVLKLNENVNK